MKSNPLPSPHALARAFASELRDEIQDAIFTVVALNDDEAEPNICHSHDFCDANQVMIDAWAKVAGVECSCDSNNEAETALWNEAWDIAKKAKFSRPVLLALELYHAGHRIDKTGKLVDPAKRLVVEELAVAINPSLTNAIIRAAVHMVNVWSLNPDKLGIPDKI